MYAFHVLNALAFFRLIGGHVLCFSRFVVFRGWGTDKSDFSAFLSNAMFDWQISVQTDNLSFIESLGFSIYLKFWQLFDSKEASTMGDQRSQDVEGQMEAIPLYPQLIDAQQQQQQQMNQQQLGTDELDGNLTQADLDR